MLAILKALFSKMQPKLNTTCITSDEFKREHPSVTQKRALAKENLKNWGRKSMLEGGEFSFSQNNVLKRVARNQ